MCFELMTIVFCIAETEAQRGSGYDRYPAVCGSPQGSGLGAGRVKTQAPYEIVEQSSTGQTCTHAGWRF